MNTLLLRYVLLPAAILVTSATAELPLSTYQRFQEKAPEVIAIKVGSVTTKESEVKAGTSIAVTAEARVETVVRSASGLEPGKVIRIVYTRLRPKQPIAGPRQVPLLKEGETCPAFLTKEGDDTTYKPAAIGFSFRVLKP